jgi:large subunit ribosomal protein L10
MSKQVKQMQMSVLKAQFQDVRDVVFLSAQGVDAISENTMRLALRKKNIRLQMVKNSLMRRVLGEIGLAVPESVWSGPTVVAWGGENVKDLSKEIETQLKADKVKTKLSVKSVLADGAATTFEMALKMPTRLEAIGEVIAAAIGPAGQIAAGLIGPAGQVASQIATIAEKGVETPAA